MAQTGRGSRYIELLDNDSATQKSETYELAKRSEDASPLTIERGTRILPPRSSTSHPHKPSLLERYEQSWMPEPFALLLSAGALISIVVLLSIHDGKRVPNWRFSLNSVISWLSMVASMGALYAASHGISQLKWLHFTQRHRRLTDMKKFDQGSRGILGAIELLWSLRARHLAALGAIAIILRIAFGPFIQNLIRFQDGLVVDLSQEARVARTQIYSRVGPKWAYNAVGVDTALKASVYSSLFQATTPNISQPLYSCSSGNCTFDTFSTFSFCPQCIDVSDQLVYKCELDSSASPTTCNVSFPDGGEPSMGFDASSGIGGIDSVYFTVANTGKPKNGTGPFAVYRAIKADVDVHALDHMDTIDVLREDTKMIGTECSMTPCVQRINASVTNGQYHETILDATFGTSMNSGPDYLGAHNVTVHPPWTEEVYGMGEKVYAALATTSYWDKSFMDVMIAGTVNDREHATALNFNSDTIQAIFYANFTNENCDNPKDTFACAFKSVGRGLTKGMRDASMPADAPSMKDVAIGEVWVDATFIKVRWEWFILPVAVWVLSLVTWCGSMWKTRRVGVPLWRDDVLPLVFLYREDGGEALSDSYGNEVKDYKMKAEGLKLRLKGRDGHLRLAEN